MTPTASAPGVDAHSQWQRFCSQLWHNPSLGFWLDVSRMGLDEAVLSSLRPRFKEAFQAMHALEGGAIANADEQRQVGHYWLRNPQLAPDPASGQHIQEEIDRIESFGRDVLSGAIQPAAGDRFTDVLWIGIGGSGLGPLLMIRALQDPGAGLPFHFFDNVDPDGMRRTLASLGERLKTTLVIVVSKSGGTPEPHIGMLQARRAVEAAGGTWIRQAVAVTMLGSRLDQEAEQGDWLARFDMFDWVGGRTSITSAVGLLPGVLIGSDIRAFLAGAAEMDAVTRAATSLDTNPAALLAAAWFHAGGGRGQRDMVVLPYRDRLEVFSRYLQQLVMESLGKKLDRQGNVVHQGIAVYGNKGSTDQHAYVQQLRDGVDNYFVTFIEVLEDPGDIPPLEGENPGDFLDGFLQGTRSALTEEGRFNLSITMQKLDARSLGALIALFERAVGYYGELVNINAYHQPGVEAGKKAAAALLDLQARLEQAMGHKREHTLAELQQLMELPSPEPLYWILRHLCANRRHIAARGDWGQPETLVFTHD
ncbi:glucose-6-phosphate isomerase [Synechococcus sp. HK05]|uniref:glucose-6-phosphate isomerase n=1 Tax=Synechococcus sp. HK05 TaxID=2725975 RepID=UPI001C37F057|nr:glucose-6-phosphate isomerase [Synechococcus sp. HK05]MBV2350859.1 glucose-6-phosphate isomerase [Synechococcus sp. HK05]